MSARTPSRFRRLLRLAPRPAHAAQDLDEEVRLHLELRAEQLRARGLPDAEARAEALRRFGGAHAVQQLRAGARRGRARALRREWLGAVGQDLRYAVRQLRGAPAFTAAAVLTFALALGANATMFGIVDRLLLRPPAHLADPDATHRLYFAGWDARTRGPGFSSHGSYVRFTELQEAARGQADVAALFTTEHVVGEGEAAREERVAAVSASTFRVFDVRPALGRVFTEEEDRAPAGTPVVVLGHAYWRSAFAGRRDVLGRSLRVGGKQYTVVGVAPPGFQGHELAPVVAFVPVTAMGEDLFGARYAQGHTVHWVELLVRRAPGTDARALEERLSATYARSRAAEPLRGGRGGAAEVEAEAPRVVLTPVPEGRSPRPGAQVELAVWLTGMALVVLLVACANVTNLLLARALRRTREVAVRVALGVSRARLVAQLLVESVLLALLGSAAGLALAHWGGGALRALLLPDLGGADAAPDARVLAATAAAAVTAGLLAGLAPALHGARTDVGEALKSGGAQGGVARSRLRTGLLVAQVALCAVLLAGAGLFARSLHNVRALPLGYDAEQLLYVEPSLRGTKLTDAEGRALRERVREAAAAVPGVESAALSASVPFYIAWNEELYDREGRKVADGPDCYANAVSPGYFATAGTRLLRGRGPEAGDTGGAPPVVVVSESMARKLWPDGEALGQCVRVGKPEAPCATVVGVAEDIRRSGDYAAGSMAQYYLAAAQREDGVDGLLVRARGDARAQLEPVRRELQKLMPGTAFVTARAVSDFVDQSLRAWKLGATLFSLFGALALLLAAVGLYGVIASDVAQRTHELGVRAALGARTRDVLRMVVGEGARLALAGVALGTGAVLLGGRALAPLLFRVEPWDPATLAGVGAVLVAVALGASALPAWRAARVPPGEALRAD